MLCAGGPLSEAQLVQLFERQFEQDGLM